MNRNLSMGDFPYETRFQLLPKDIQNMVTDYVEWSNRIYREWTNILYNRVIEPNIKEKSFFNEEAIKDKIVLIFKKFYGEDLFPYILNTGSYFLIQHTSKMASELDKEIIVPLNIANFGPMPHLKVKLPTFHYVVNDVVLPPLDELVKSYLKPFPKLFEIILKFDQFKNIEDQIIEVTKDSSSLELYEIAKSFTHSDIDDLHLIIEEPPSPFDIKILPRYPVSLSALGLKDGSIIQVAT